MNSIKVGVIGSGLMGIGIATTICRNHFEVCMLSNSDDASNRLQKYIAREAQKERITEREKDLLLSNIKVVSYENIGEVGKCDLIIESTYENKELKKDIFRRLNNVTNDETIVCTNTSTLSVTELASEYKNPEKFAGMHFFSPVSSMKLVEVVKGFLTMDSVVDKLISFGQEIGKEPVKVNDNPGFILNRIIAPYISEAVGILEGGIANVEDIDCVIRHCLGAQVGPLQLGDYIGLDVVKRCSDILFDAYKDTKYISNLLNKKYYAKEIGKKVGRGFYTYE